MKRLASVVAVGALFGAAVALGAPSAAADKKACFTEHAEAQVAQHAGRLLAARKHLSACAQPSCPGLIVTDCAEWLDQVEKSLPSIVLLATDEAGTNLADVTVTADGTLLLAKLDGRAIDVDPGTHTFRFEAPDGRHVQEEVLVGVGEKNKRIVVQLGGASPAAVASVPVATGVVASPSEPTTTRGSPLRVAGLVTAAVGVVGLGVGAGFGVDAIVEQHDAHCPNNQCRPGSNPGALGDAQTAGTLSTVFFVAGGVLTAGGLLTWWLAPRGSATTAWIRPVPLTLARGGGVGFVGAW